MPNLELLSDEELASIAGVRLTSPGAGQIEAYTGSNCGDALANWLNTGPLKDTGLSLPRGGVGPGDLASLGKARGAAVYGKGDLSEETLTPGTVIHMTRQPGERNYEYGATHIGIVEQDADGKVFKSFTAGKGWRSEPVNQDFIARLPNQITATNPVNPEAGGGFLATVGDWLGPKAAEAAGAGRNLEDMSDDELAQIAGVKLQDMSDEDLARIAGVQLQPREPLGRDEFMGAVQGLDVGPGLYEGPQAGRYPGTAGEDARPTRPPGVYAEERSLLDTAKDYLGYRELPAFLPVRNRETGDWEAGELYQVRKLFHGWDEPTELERVLEQGLRGLTLGWSDVLEKDIRGQVTGAPETMAGTVAGAGLQLGTFMLGPYGAAKLAWGGRLEPTRSGLRGLAQVMAHGGATLGTATAISSVIPSLLESESLTEAGYNFIKGTASGAMVGALFPVLGGNTGKPVSGALRVAAGLAALDFARTRLHQAPDQGWFTLDDVARGAVDGTIDRNLLAQKTFDYLLDLYFLAKTPTMRRTVESLKVNAVVQEAAKVSAQEAEDVIIEIGKSGGLRVPPPRTEPEKQGLEVRGQEPEEQVAGVRGQVSEKAAEGYRDPYQENLDKQQELLKAVEVKIGRARSEKSKEKLGLERSVIQEEISRLQKIVDEKPESAYGVPAETAPEASVQGQETKESSTSWTRPQIIKALKANKPVPPEELAKHPDLAQIYGSGVEVKIEPRPEEPPDYAFIQIGDPVFDRDNPRAGGFVERETAAGFVVVDPKGRETLIPKEKAVYLNSEAAGKFFGGGPGTEEIAAAWAKAKEVGGKIIRFIDDRLESNLPEGLRDPDASKTLGVLALKLQRWDDVGRTYPAAAKVFEAGRSGLAVKSYFAQDFSVLWAPYNVLKPAERAKVDALMVEMDLDNNPDLGREFRLPLHDFEVWRRYLVNPPEDIQVKGVSFYMTRGLSEREARGAFAQRMTLDYARAALIDGQLSALQNWLYEKGFDNRRIHEITQELISPMSSARQVATSIFGEKASPGLVREGGRVLKGFQWEARVFEDWLANRGLTPEAAQEVMGRLMRLPEMADPAKAMAAELFGETVPKDAADMLAGFRRQYREYARWLKGKRLEPDEIAKVTGELLGAKRTAKVVAETFFGKEVPPKLVRILDNFRESMEYWLKEEHQYIPHARFGEFFIHVVDKASGELVHTAAADGKADYQQKRRELEAAYPEAEGFAIKEKLEKPLPMEIWVEQTVPKVWLLLRDAQGKMTPEAGDAMIESWQDMTAAKGFGAHYIRRSNVPGYEVDLQRPVAEYLSGLAGYLGKMEKVRGFSEALQAPELRQMPNVLREVNNYCNYVLSNPKEFEGVRNVIYHWTLGGNLSFHFINTLQNLNTGWAALGKVSASPLKDLAAAYKDWVRFQTTGEGLSDKEQRALLQARREPELAPSGVAELSGRAYNPLFRYLNRDPESLTRRGMDWVKGIWTGEIVEKLNRETFWLAAYRASGDYDKPLELIRDAHFLYGKETRPAAARGVGAPFFIFLTYTTGYFTLLKNFGKAAYGANPEVYGGRADGFKGLARMFAGGLVTAGLSSAPFWPLIKAAWTKVFGTDLEDEGKVYLNQELGLGKDLSEFAVRSAVRGLPAAALGLDISSRVAPNLPMTNLPPGDTRWQDLVGAALGASSIPLQRVFQAGKTISEGDWGRTLEALLPVSLANVAAAGRMSREGVTTLKGRPIFTREGEPLQPTTGELVRKGAGFQPTRIAEHYSHTRLVQDLESDRRSKIQGFAGALVRAIREEDADAFDRTVDEVAAWNNKMEARGRPADIIESEALDAAVEARFRPVHPAGSEKRTRLRELGLPSLADTLVEDEREESQ